MRTNLLCILAFGVALTGCDPIWVRDSYVTIRSDAFPQCVSEALIEIGFTPTPDVDARGHMSLRISAPSGFFWVELAAPEVASPVDVVVMFRGLGREPTGQRDSAIRDILTRVSTGISRKCGNG